MDRRGAIQIMAKSARLYHLNLEEMNLAGGRLLDIEFNEIKSGYRLRYRPETL